MSVYDQNWKSYAMYVTSTVETNCNYGSVESWAMAGIGIMQWTYGRSWDLLNLLITDYPDTANQLPILLPQIQAGRDAWGNKIFTQNEANEVSAVLVTDEGVNTQNKLWESDCDNSYIPLLRDECGITDPKTAIFGLTNYHQSPQAFYQIFNGCGNCNYDVWYMTVLNNGIVGSYSNRQNTVKALLDEWDGESGKEGFGNYDPQHSIGGNQNQNSGNPDNTSKPFETSINIKSLQKFGKTFFLYLDNQGTNKKIEFYQASDKLWLPIYRNEKIQGETTTTPQPSYPDTGTGTPDQRQQLVDKILTYEGKLGYSQSGDLRMWPDNGYADCSGLVWHCYNSVVGVEIGTWTGTQVENGTLIKEGSGTLDTSDLLNGDLVFFNWWYHNPYFDHVEMYIGNNQLCGHGGDPYYGPTVKPDAGAYSRDAFDWQVRRYI